MKIAIIANNLSKWKTWDKKIQELKDWWMPEVDLDITLIHTDFKNIPFVDYTNSDGRIYKGIEPKWFDDNMSRPYVLKGYDCVMLTLAEKDWVDKKVEGWNTENNLGIQEIQILGRENARYNFNGVQYEGDQWFNIARHELSHAIYRSRGIEDNTHKWWTLGRLDEVKRELAGGFMSHWLVLYFQRLINPVKTLRYFNQNEVEGLDKDFVFILDEVRHQSGFPFVVNSGYRAGESNHGTGLAIDLKSTGGKFYEMVKTLRNSGWNGNQVYNLAKIILNEKQFDNDRQAVIVRNAIKQGIERIGVYNKHTHLDAVKDKTLPSIWFGTSE